MSPLKAGAVAVLALATGPLAGLPQFTPAVPAGIPPMGGWERIAGELEFESPRLSVQYEFWVNPERPAIYELVRYRVVEMGPVAPGRAYPVTEKLQWDRDGRDIRRFECVAEPGGGCAWREMAKGGQDYVREVPVVMWLYGVHRRVAGDRARRLRLRRGEDEAAAHVPACIIRRGGAGADVDQLGFRLAAGAVLRQRERLVGPGGDARRVRPAPVAPAQLPKLGEARVPGRPRPLGTVEDPAVGGQRDDLDPVEAVFPKPVADQLGRRPEPGRAAHAMVERKRVDGAKRRRPAELRGDRAALRRRKQRRILGRAGLRRGGGAEGDEEQGSQPARGPRLPPLHSGRLR
jgi:hypothetical protein